MEITFNLSEISGAAETFLEASAGCKVFLFYAEMGSGKTTFIKELCRQKGVAENVSSPTFSIINEYRSANNEVVYHLDLYRLESEEEAVQAGVEETLYSGELCYVEWPEKVEKLMPADAAMVRIEVISDQTRKLSLHLPENLPDIR